MPLNASNHFKLQNIRLNSILVLRTCLIRRMARHEGWLEDPESCLQAEDADLAYDLVDRDDGVLVGFTCGVLCPVGGSSSQKIRIAERLDMRGRGEEAYCLRVFAYVVAIVLVDLV